MRRHHPEAIRQQSEFSGQIASSVTTLGLALLIAFTAAVGEEIAFRGALQPIFGLTLTSLLFAVIHVQYTLTPASGLILVLAFTLGWLRLRYNTTVAIIAHFLYNFVLLFLAVVAVYGQQLQQMVR
jgi:membrane protease YdiL (CAAX protease family)